MGHRVRHWPELFAYQLALIGFAVSPSFVWLVMLGNRTLVRLGIDRLT